MGRESRRMRDLDGGEWARFCFLKKMAPVGWVVGDCEGERAFLWEGEKD